MYHFLQPPLTLFLIQGLSIELGLSNLTRLLASEPQGLQVSASPELGLETIYHHAWIFLWVLGLNSGPCVCNKATSQHLLNLLASVITLVDIGGSWDLVADQPDHTGEHQVQQEILSSNRR